jgi:hypothetical protein
MMKMSDGKNNEINMWQDGINLPVCKSASPTNGIKLAATENCGLMKSLSIRLESVASSS